MPEACLVILGLPSFDLSSYTFPPFLRTKGVITSWGAVSKKKPKVKSCCSCQPGDDEEEGESCLWWWWWWWWWWAAHCLHGCPRDFPKHVLPMSGASPNLAPLRNIKSLHLANMHASEITNHPSSGIPCFQVSFGDFSVMYCLYRYTVISPKKYPLPDSGMPWWCYIPVCLNGEIFAPRKWRYTSAFF